MSVTSSISAASAEPSLLYVNTDTVGTGANTDETTLASYTLPANTLDVDGDYIEVRATGGGNDTGDIRLYFGSVAITVSGQTVTGKTWEIIARIYRTGASSQKTVIQYTANSNSLISLGAPAVFSEVGSLAETLSSNLDIYVTGQNASPMADDLTIETFTVEHIGQ